MTATPPGEERDTRDAWPTVIVDVLQNIQHEHGINAIVWQWAIAQIECSSGTFFRPRAKVRRAVRGRSRTRSSTWPSRSRASISMYPEEQPTSRTTGCFVGAMPALAVPTRVKLYRSDDPIRRCPRGRLSVRRSNPTLLADTKEAPPTARRSGIHCPSRQDEVRRQAAEATEKSAIGAPRRRRSMQGHPSTLDWTPALARGTTLGACDMPRAPKRMRNRSITLRMFPRTRSSRLSPSSLQRMPIS